MIRRNAKIVICFSDGRAVEFTNVATDLDREARVLIIAQPKEVNFFPLDGIRSWFVIDTSDVVEEAK